jgi:hypothetical protein
MRYYNGPLVGAEGLGAARWVSALVDWVGLPPGLPLLVFALCSAFHILSGAEDITLFALLWLIPEGFLFAVNRHILNEPSQLIAAPLLWTAIAVGVPSFTRRIPSYPPWAGIGAVAGSFLYCFLAVTAYWAFFIQYTLLGYGLLGLTMAVFLAALLRTRKIRRRQSLGWAA